jgi:hypothetical protein
MTCNVPIIEKLEKCTGVVDVFSAYPKSPSDCKSRCISPGCISEPEIILNGAYGYTFDDFGTPSSPGKFLEIFVSKIIFG